MAKIRAEINDKMVLDSKRKPHAVSIMAEAAYHYVPRLSDDNSIDPDNFPNFRDWTQEESRPGAPLGLPASVRPRVHQLTDPLPLNPLLRPAPPEGSRRPAGRVAEASAQGPVPLWAGWKFLEWRPGRSPDSIAH